MRLAFIIVLHSYLVTQIVCLEEQPFSTPGKEVRSKVLEKDIALTGVDVSQNLLDGNGNEPIGTNQQFGYYVDLVSFPLTNYTSSSRGEIYIQGAEPDGLVAVSAPGSPDLKSTTAGFVELHSHNFIPITKTKTHALKKNNGNNNGTEERVFVVLYPDIGNWSDSHSMFGHSFSHVQAISKSGSRMTEVWMHTGAPQSATCEPKDQKGRDDTFRAAGSVFEHKLYDRLSRNDDTFGQKNGHSLNGTCVDGLADSGKAKKEDAQSYQNELGFSVHKSIDELFMIVGAPLFSEQRGIVEIYSRKTLEDTFDKILADGKEFYQCAEKDPLGSHECEQNDSTYGYSVCSLDTHYYGLYFVAGGPRAENFRGKIKIFKILNKDTIISSSANKTRNSTINLNSTTDMFEFLDPLVGSDSNTGFGTTVVAVNLDGDNVDEFVVGEPYYTDPISGTVNSGRVSIYHLDDWGYKLRYTLVYSFFSPAPFLSNMFGFKVATVGDLNADGYEDLLVTALNETTHEGKGRGKVYIFCGRSLTGMFKENINENRLKQPLILQEFTVEDSKLFGFSIGESRVDLDGNGFNDLIIGDPGNAGQFARVYYSKTFIKLSSWFEPSFSDCPKELLENNPSNYSCYFLGNSESTISNIGSERLFSDYKNNRYKSVTPWPFQNEFSVEVNLTIETMADYLPTKLQLYNPTQTVTFGPNVNSTKIDVWIYGESLPPSYAEFFTLNVFFNLTSGDKIVLDREYANAPTVLKPVQIFNRPNQFYMPFPDPMFVSMTVLKYKQQVFLGARQKYLAIPIRFERFLIREKNAFIWAADLKIHHGDAPLKYSTVSSDPPNLLSCTQLDYHILCKFYNGITFATADVVITVSIGELASGMYHEDQVILQYTLDHWGLLDHATSIIQLEYNDFQHLEKTSEVFLFKNGEKFELRHSVVLTNQGPSKTGKFKVVFFAPYDPSKFEIIGTPEECRKLDQKPIPSEGNCSSNNCQKYECIVMFSGEHSHELKMDWQITLLGANYTTALLAKEMFLMEFDYEIVQDVVLKSDPRSASVTSDVFVRSNKGQYWPVLLAFFVSAVIVVAAIFTLSKMDYFTKEKGYKTNVVSFKRRDTNN